MTSRHDKPPIADVFPELSPEEQREAAERLREYIEVVIEIAREVESDPDKWKLYCELTGRDPRRTVDDDTVIEW